MQEFPNFVPAFSHHFKALVRYGAISRAFAPHLRGFLRSQSAINRKRIGNAIAAPDSLPRFQYAPVWGNYTQPWRDAGIAAVVEKADSLRE